MTWITLATALLKVVSLIMGYVKDKQLLDAGEAKNAVKAMEAVNAEVEKVRAAIAAIQSSPEWAERLRRLADRDK